MSTTYKLIYFDLKGRGEVSRLLFALGEQAFEDKRLTFQEWPEAKPTLPFGQAPVLEITENSRTYAIAQSHAIERYLANKFHLMGRNEIERAQCDMIGEQVVDAFNSLILIYRASYSKSESEEKTKKDLEEAMRDKVPANLKLIEKILEANKQGNGFLVGDALTLGDLQLVMFYDWLRESKSEVLGKVPLLKQHEEKIKAIPKVAEHLKKIAGARLTILFPN